MKLCITGYGGLDFGVLSGLGHSGPDSRDEDSPEGFWLYEGFTTTGEATTLPRSDQTQDYQARPSSIHAVSSALYTY